jgi:hypothetical protein
VRCFSYTGYPYSPRAGMIFGGRTVPDTTLGGPRGCTTGAVIQVHTGIMYPDCFGQYAVFFFFSHRFLPFILISYTSDTNKMFNWNYENRYARVCDKQIDWFIILLLILGTWYLIIMLQHQCFKWFLIPSVYHRDFVIIRTLAGFASQEKHLE